MGMTSYTMPVIYNTAVGEIHWKLFVDSSLPALTIPTTCNILNIGKIKESVDVQTGVIDVANCDITMAEDYSAYSDGFWYHIINSDAYRALNVELSFTIVENGVETFLYRGGVFRSATTWNELYLDNTTSPTRWIRVHILQLSENQTLKNTSVQNVIDYLKSTYMASNYLYVASAPSGPAFLQKTAKFNELFKSIIEVAYGSAGECVEIGQDVKVLDRNGVTYSWLSMAFTVQTQHDAPGGALEDSIFIAQSIAGKQNSYAWVNRFSSAYDLLVYLCSVFLAVPRIKFDVSSDVPYVEVSYRGNHGSPSGFLTMNGGISESTITSLDATQPVSFNIVDPLEGTTDSYFSFPTESGVLYGQPLLSQSFDVSIQTDFIQGIYSSTDGSGNDIWDVTHAGYYTIERFLFVASDFLVTNMQVYDYYNGIYYDAGISTMPNNFSTNLCYYLKQRFRNSRISYTRTYSSLQSNNGSTTSQANTKCLAGTQINDGVTTRNFYATAVEKDVMTNRATITWVQE